MTAAQKPMVARFKYDKNDGTVPTKQRQMVVLEESQAHLFGLEYETGDGFAKIKAYLLEKQAIENYLKHKYGFGESGDPKFRRFKQSGIVDRRDLEIDM